MNIREVADALVRETQDMRWQNARDAIALALARQYNIGFLDGEAEVRGKLGLSREEVEAASDPTWGTAEAVEGAGV